LLELKNIKIDIFTPKTPKNQKFKTFKMSCKETSKEKSSENKLYLELKNINNVFFENIKNSKITSKTPKKQNSKRHIIGLK